MINRDLKICGYSNINELDYVDVFLNIKKQSTYQIIDIITDKNTDELAVLYTEHPKGRKVYTRTLKNFNQKFQKFANVIVQKKRPKGILEGMELLI